MVSSLKIGRTGGRNWRDPLEKSMSTGGDGRGAEAEDRMVCHLSYPTSGEG